MKYYFEIHSRHEATAAELVYQMDRLPKTPDSWNLWKPRRYGEPMLLDLSIIDLTDMTHGDVVSAMNACNGRKIAAWGYGPSVVGLAHLPLEFTVYDIFLAATGALVDETLAMLQNGKACAQQEPSFVDSQPEQPRMEQVLLNFTARRRQNPGDLVSLG
jgi:hypothetical protein